MIHSAPAVLGFGLLVCDELAVLERHPGPDEKARIHESLRQAGGPVPTALAVLARFGYGTALAAAVGDDERGRFLRSQLAAAGIDDRLVRERSGARSPFAHVWLDRNAGTRTVAWHPGTAEPPGFEEIFPILPVSLLYLDAQQPETAGRLIAACREQCAGHINHDSVMQQSGPLSPSAGHPAVFLDTGTWRPATVPLLALPDVIQMPRAFAVGLAGPAPLPELARVAAACCKKAWLVVVTDGKNGSAASVHGELVETPAFPVATVDSCGAGDIHGGALAAALLEGLAPVDALRFAAAAAALKCGVFGNSAAPADRAAVLHLTAPAMQPESG